MALVFQLTQDSKEVLRISQESGKSLNHLHSCLSDIKTRANESLTSIVEAEKLNNGQSQWKLSSYIHVHSAIILSGHFHLTCSSKVKLHPLTTYWTMIVHRKTKLNRKPKSLKTTLEWPTSCILEYIEWQKWSPSLDLNVTDSNILFTSLITRQKELDNFTFKLRFLICTTWISSLVL